MAANFLTRRLAGLSLSLSRGGQFAAILAMRRANQPVRALTSLLPARGNDDSSASSSALSPPARPSAGAGARGMSSMPTPPAVAPSGSVYDDTAAADAEDEASSLEASSGRERRRTSRTHYEIDGMLVPKYRKIAPRIVARRIKKLKTYAGNEKSIRHSPWRMNLICQFAAGMTVPEADNQLRFTRKSKAPLLRKVIKRTANLADIRDDLQPSQLEVAECFATHGHRLKRLKIHARGRSGTMRHRYSHIRLVLREIDFDLKIAQATTRHQKMRWIEKRRLAEQDAAEAKAEREELERLEREAEEKKAKEKEGK